MSLYLRNTQREHLALLKRPATDVVELCKASFDYLVNGPNPVRYEHLAQKYAGSTNASAIQQTVEALIALLIDATKANPERVNMAQVLRRTLPELSDDVLEVLEQFVTSKRSFIEGSIKSASIRAHRLVNIEWRLEVRTATRSLLKQCQVFITMKLYLHTEPKNENRDLLEVEASEPKPVIHADERRNRRDLLVQTDVNSLSHIIKTLEDALLESKTRRIRNIVDAIH